jgi:hypothetical protein
MTTHEQWRDHLRGYGWMPALYDGVDIMVWYPWEQKQALAEWKARGRDGVAPPQQFSYGGNSYDLALLPDGRILRTGMECGFTSRWGRKPLVTRGVITKVVLPVGAEGGMVCWFRHKLKNGVEVNDYVTTPADIAPAREKRWRPPPPPVT